MRIDYGYRSKRLVPIQIIRNLIDLATFLYCYILYNNKRDYLNKYKRGEPISKFKIRNKYVSYNKLLEGTEDYDGLDKRFEGLKKLYLYCCTYVCIVAMIPIRLVVYGIVLLILAISDS